MGLEPTLPDEGDGEIGVFRGSDDRESDARNRKKLVPGEEHSDDADAEEDDDQSEQVDRARRVFPVKSRYVSLVSSLEFLIFSTNLLAAATNSAREMPQRFQIEVDEAKESRYLSLKSHHRNQLVSANCIYHYF